MTEQADAGMDTPKSLREYITNTVINTVPPLIAYYVLRVFDFEPYLALVGAIITAAAQGALTMVRKRKVEPANVVVIVGAVCSLTIALTTKNPRIVQALGRTNVPVPAVHGWNPALRATLFARDPGRSDVDKLTDPRQQRAVMGSHGVHDI